MRAITSAKLMPAAATAIRTSPGPSEGSGCSWTSRTPGPPCLVMTTAFIAVGRLLGSAELHGPAVDETLGGDDLLDDVLVHLGVGRDDHRGQAPVLAAVCPGWGIGGVPDGGGGDVDAVLAEDRADAADHPGQVLVAEDGDVGLQLDRQAPALHLD